MSRRQLARPSDPADRRDRCIDAVADLDMFAVYMLVCHWGATVHDIQDAAEQTGRSVDELWTAFCAWKRAKTSPALTARQAGRLTTTLTQPSIPGLELS
ncbi:hypothetical protein [Glycomyces sp. MUSA5-2]|uniref:hypothetical protein n=1 Tax=Glycomyces sp. MUSA5-2 TaxID=2053002 RepID=UPI00300AD14A